VYENPTTEFVAGFLGASNLLDGAIVSKDADTARVRIEGGGEVTLRAARLQGDDTAVRLGVRPEKLTLRSGGEDARDGWNSVPGTVRISTFIGVSHQYTVDGPAGRSITVYAQYLGREVAPRAGETVHVEWKPEHTFVVAPSEPLAAWEEAP
jgi:spermidine/putrescine transport system ATP-binding protein